MATTRTELLKERTEAYRSWINSNRMVEKFKNVIPKNGFVLAEVFVITDKSQILNPDSEEIFQDAKVVIDPFNIARIIAGEGYKSGEIVRLPNEVGTLIPNPDYDNIVARNANNPRDPKIPEVKYLGENIYTWLEKYEYKANPFLSRASQLDWVMLFPGYLCQAHDDISLVLGK